MKDRITHVLLFGIVLGLAANILTNWSPPVEAQAASQSDTASDEMVRIRRAVESMAGDLSSVEMDTASMRMDLENLETLERMASDVSNLLVVMCSQLMLVPVVDPTATVIGNPFVDPPVTTTDLRNLTVCQR